MKSLIRFGLLTALPFLLIPQPSFGKETWLKCGSRPIILDDVKERFEINLVDETRQGKAHFFKSAIKFEYITQLATIKWLHTWEIDRANLNYKYSMAITPDGLGAPQGNTGTCKVIPAPSGKTNKI